MPRLTRRCSLGALGVLVALGPFAGPAAAQDAGALISGIANKVLALLRAGVSDDERERALAEILRDSFNMPAIGRMVLGRHWNVATPEQRQRFLAAFEKAEVKAYSNRFKEYAGQSLIVGKVTRNSPQEMVDAQIIQPNGQPIKLVWEVVDGKIVDVTIEGVSMAITRRSDFNAYIQRHGIDGLIAELERRGG
ncbi:MAG: ABC transporter substrate-binding protein [Alphaproteobacteria bacterium]|nr:ABC transporter substrate-binding protein [Alphaproteobacteria bacterium]